MALLSGCQSAPLTGGSLPPTSSMLAVDVLFPAPLNRDPSLVQAFFVKGPLDDGADELPQVIPATFVKWSRAYLLDPEPGTYSLVAVTAEFAPPWNNHPIDGVTDTVWSGTSSDAMIFPAELIHRTRATVAPGAVTFMGALRVRRGDRINADAVPEEELQKRIAERIRPGVTTASGLEGWLKRARTVDLENTALSNQPADREAFFEGALEDLGDSPWADFVARAAPSSAPRIARPRALAPRIESREETPVKSDAEIAAERSPAPIPEMPAAKPQPTVAGPAPEPAEAEPSISSAAPPEPAEVEPSIASAAPPEPEPLPVAPRPKPEGIPPESPLAEIELGMKHDEVLEILGSPSRRIDRLTAKAWNPFYNGPDANLREWIYAGRGRVVFSLYQGSLEVIDVVYDPDQEK